MYGSPYLLYCSHSSLHVPVPQYASTHRDDHCKDSNASWVLKTPLYYLGKRQRLRDVLLLFSISLLLLCFIPLLCFCKLLSSITVLRCSFVNHNSLVRKLDVHYTF